MNEDFYIPERYKSCSCVGFPQYQVSNNGNVRHIGKKDLLKQRLNEKGYYEVQLYNRQTKKNKRFPVHKLVMSVFQPLVIHHINFDKTDNRLNNLVWLTATQHNIIHSNKKSNL